MHAGRAGPRGRAAQVQVLADHCFEEVAALDGVVEDVGEADLELPDAPGDGVAGGPIGPRSAARAAARPSDRRTPARRPAPVIADGLQAGRVAQTQEAIVQALEAIPSRRSCCLTHSWPLRHSLIG